MGLATLLLLTDSRLPAGGHAHSGGVEAAVAAGRVHDVDSLGTFLGGRLGTAGLVAGAFAACACHDPGRAAELDDGLDARTPSPALRKTSRAQGRALLRAGRSMWSLVTVRHDPHHSVALGLVAAAAGLTPQEAALAAAYHAVSGPAGAAVRLLGLDPYAVQHKLAHLMDSCDIVATRAAAMVHDDVDDLPANSAPLLDISAEQHATWEVRLFAS